MPSQFNFQNHSFFGIFFHFDRKFDADLSFSNSSKVNEPTPPALRLINFLFFSEMQRSFEIHRSCIFSVRHAWIQFVKKKKTKKKRTHCFCQYSYLLSQLPQKYPREERNFVMVFSLLLSSLLSITYSRSDVSYKFI